MKRCDTRSALPLSLLLAVAASGCVSGDVFDAVKAERDKLGAENANLEKRVEMLEAANASLEEARFALIEKMENLRQSHDSAQRDLQRLKRAEAELSESLAAREAELASTEAEIAKLRGAYEGLVSDLESEVATGRIQIEQLRDGLTLNLSQEIMFESGSANLAKGGEALVRTVAERLKTLPNRIEVRGHTDNVALQGSAFFPSNWELAAARAARVVRILVDAGVNPERLSVVSFGPYAPIASNETPEGRAMNRRIEIGLEPIVVDPESPAKPEPTVAP